jgi:hypothetical protein
MQPGGNDYSRGTLIFASQMIFRKGNEFSKNFYDIKTNHIWVYAISRGF